jgi:hypothetical protein
MNLPVVYLSSFPFPAAEGESGYRLAGVLGKPSEKSYFRRVGEFKNPSDSTGLTSGLLPPLTSRHAVKIPGGSRGTMTR